MKTQISMIAARRPSPAASGNSLATAPPRSGRAWLRPGQGLLAAGLAWVLTGCSSGSTEPPPPMTRVIERPAPPVAAAPAPAQAPAPVPAAAPVAPSAEKPDAQVAVAPELPALSPGVAEMIQLAQSGVGEKVLLEYAKDSPVAYDLTSAEIVYLKDLGISEPVIEAMLKRGRELRAQGVAASGATAAPGEAATAASSESTTAPAEPAPAPPVYANPVSTPAAQTVAPAGEVAAAPPATVTNNYYYGALAPYGSWVYGSDYGWVWRPTCAVVDPGWRPYANNGGWVYTDAGYYWQSYYSWGWAPFHYGRWYLSPTWGWCWRPGYVWGPSWVTWRTYGDYLGWAPLPPAVGWSAGVGLTWHGSGVSVSFGFGISSGWYTFVPSRRFCDPYPVHYAVAGPQVVNVYKNSTVINNVVVGDNNTVINRGIAPERLPARTRQELRRAELRDLPSNSRAPIRPDTLDPRRHQLAVYRPKVPPQLTAPSKSDRSRFDPPYHAATRKASWERPTPTRPTATTLATRPSRSVALAPSPSRPSRSPARAGSLMPTRRTSVPTAPSRHDLAHTSRPGKAVPSRVTPLPARTPSVRTTRPTPRNTPSRSAVPSRSNPGSRTAPSRSAPGRSAAPASRPSTPSRSIAVPRATTPPRTVPAPRSTTPSRRAPSRSVGTIQPTAPSTRSGAAPSRTTRGTRAPVYAPPTRTPSSSRTPTYRSVQPATPTRTAPAVRPSTPSRGVPSARSSVPSRSTPSSPTFRSTPSRSGSSFLRPSTPRTPSFATRPRSTPTPRATTRGPSFARPSTPSRSLSRPATPAPSFSRPSAPSRSFSRPSTPSPSFSRPSTPSRSLPQPSTRAPSFSRPTPSRSTGPSFSTRSKAPSPVTPTGPRSPQR